MLANTEALRAEYRNVWVLAEVLGGEVQKVTWELLGAARGLADARGSELWCVLLGDGVSKAASQVHGYGADLALVVDDPRLARFDDEAEAAVLVRLVERYKPEILIAGATTRGRALVPRVAVKAECGLTADCTGLAIDPATGDLLQTRPAFGGNIMATIRCSQHRPQMATVRPRVMSALDFDPSRRGRILAESLLPGEAGAFKTVLEVFHDEDNAVNLSEARFIVAGGRGLKGAEGFGLLKHLADALGGAVGASRAAVDSGWIAYSHQVGQTGQTVQAQVYIACGISGQIQHLVGMQSCDYIVAIDKDPGTPLMQLADLAVVGDLYEIVPAMVRALART
jgi:electron transfer flavoprotein alpha subunit